MSICFRVALAAPIIALAACAAVPEPASTGSLDSLAKRHVQRGHASWYGPGFLGRRTASGEAFRPNEMTAAHPSLPFGTRVRVVDEATGRSVVVRINDRGPFARGRIIDLAQGPARILGVAGAGTAFVSLHPLDQMAEGTEN